MMSWPSSLSRGGSMISHDYQAGQYVRLELPYPDDADITSCSCALEPRGCWHGTGTTVLRVFQDGGLLLENRHGFVRVAHPDEVCR